MTSCKECLSNTAVPDIISAADRAFVYACTIRRPTEII
jgi:hypothetical protein